ncbi:MAG: hypothetical protein F4X66_17410 [Chloroflexi bacterium]|nr:hypothetical protein [Chloroflexota bacterium]
MNDRRRLGIDRSRSIEDLHHLRLVTLLDELVQAKGVTRAARELGVNYRTLAAALETGRLSRRMRGALGSALLEGGGSPVREQRERNEELAGRLEQVEGQVDEMGKEMTGSLAAVQGEVRELGDQHGQALQRVESRLEKVEGGDGAAGPPAASHAGNGPAGRSSPRRDFPDLATREPAADDEEVFGGAWPLIQEWRELRERHPDRGKGLEWLREEERLMSVELELLEEHGLTLPPQTYPLKGLDRGAQTGWRRKALEEARRARQRREGLLRLLGPLRALRLKLLRR